MSIKKGNTKTASEKPVNKFRAILDHRKIYRGIELVTELGPNDIEVPEECTLKPGNYIWNMAARRFDPLAPTKRSPAKDVPSLEEAFYAMIQQMEVVPQECDAWAKWYKTTLEGRTKK